MAYSITQYDGVVVDKVQEVKASPNSQTAIFHVLDLHYKEVLDYPGVDVVSVKCYN